MTTILLIIIVSIVLGTDCHKIVMSNNRELVFEFEEVSMEEYGRLKKMGPCVESLEKCINETNEKAMEACKNKGQRRGDGTVSEFVKSWITRFRECIPSCWDAAVCDESLSLMKLALGRHGPNKLRL